MTKAQAIKITTACAKEYKEHLVNRNLLFIMTDKHKQVSCLEVSFDATNFLHLTGLKVNERLLSAQKFYEKCLDGKLSGGDFEFALDGTTEMKLRVLPMMMCKSLCANCMGSYNGRQPVLYTEKIAGSVKGCLGFVRDKKMRKYIPNTILETDIRNYVYQTYRIIVTYRKWKDETVYSEIVYTAKKIDWEKISFPSEYSYLPKPT